MVRVWERCIRFIRKILNVFLKGKMYIDEVLMILMCEVELILNGRYIKKVCEDYRDVEVLIFNYLFLFRIGLILSLKIFREDTFF